MEEIKMLQYNLLLDRKISKNNHNEYVVCPTCKKNITFNGCTSHSKIHSDILIAKKAFIKNKYLFQNYCFCGNEIFVPENIKDARRKHTHFCSSECYNIAKNKVKNYYKKQQMKKKCIICGKAFNANHKDTKTCSYNCWIKLLSIKTKNVWNNRTDIEISEKISSGSLGKKGCKAWNKGLTGNDYMKHYIDENGNNSFYEALSKNDKWFRKTSIEKKFEDLLEKLNANYQYSFFTQNSQFDFLISTNNFVYIIELDGDYWHKSRRLFPNETDREMKRLEDNLKSNKIKNIINTKKNWIVLRIWEYDINNNFGIIEEWVKKLLKEEKNDETIYEIKKNYSNWS